MSEDTIDEKAAPSHNEDVESHMPQVENGWQAVTFQKPRNSRKPTTMVDKGSPVEAGISVKLFNASTGKYINTQKFKYVSKDNNTISNYHSNRSYAQETNPKKNSNLNNPKGFLLENRFSMLHQESMVSQNNNLNNYNLLMKNKNTLHAFSRILDMSSKKISY